MDPACLSGFIVPRVTCEGGTPATPRSGLYVEDLPGISCVALANVEPGKFLDAQTYIDEKMRFAGKLILEQIRMHLEPHVQERATKEAGFIGTYDETTLSGTAQKRGVRVRVEGGAMMIPCISRIWLKATTAVVGLKVYLKDGETITEYSVDIAANTETEVWLNYEAKNKTVDIYVEDADFIPYSGSTQGTTYFANCGHCGGHGRYFGIAGDGLLNGSATTALQGIRAEVVLLCSIEPVVCILFSRFKFALLYQWGVLALEEWIATPRTNYFAIHSKEWAIATLQKWNEVDLPKHMKLATEQLAGFLAKLDPDCLECGKGASYTHGHP